MPLDPRSGRYFLWHEPRGLWNIGGSVLHVGIYRTYVCIFREAVGSCSLVWRSVLPMGSMNRTSGDVTTQTAAKTTQTTTQTVAKTTQTATQTTQTHQADGNKEAELSNADKMILALIKSNPAMSQREYAMELGWSVDRVKYYLRKMKAQDRIRRKGSSHSGYWEVVE